MLCKFCNQPPQRKPLNYHDKIWWCETCSAEYVTLRNELSSVNLYTQINDVCYRVSHYDAYNDHIIIWRIEKPGVPGKVRNSGMKVIFNQKIKMDCPFTPANIKEKLSVYITFL